MAEPRKKSNKSAFRRVAEWLHLWLGLSSGLIVFIVCFTGGLWVFRYEIAYFTDTYQRVPARHQAFLPPSQLIAKTQNYLLAKKDTGVLIDLIYGKPNRSVNMIYAMGEKGAANIYVDPYDGHIIKDKRKPSGSDIYFLFVRAGHRFLWLPQKIGSPIVGSACIVFVIMMITGLIWWYPRKWNETARKKSFTIQWSAKWKRLNIDLHNVAGFYALIFLLILTLTGIYFSFGWFRNGMYHSLAWKAPVEATQDDPWSDTTLTKHAAVASSLDSVWYQTIRKHPDFGRVLLYLPHKPKDAYKASSFFGDGTIIYNRATEFYDQQTLQPLHYTDEEDSPYENLSAGQKAYRMDFDFHTGQILGLPTKILAFLACMVGASLPVTGFMIWYNRKWGKKKKSAGKAVAEV